MAYPTISSPYGLIPVKLLSGSPFVGVTRHFKIAVVVNKHRPHRSWGKIELAW